MKLHVDFVNPLLHIALKMCFLMIFVQPKLVMSSVNLTAPYQVEQ
jgi:hypothetical protein